MTFDWRYTLGLFWSRDFWQATLTVIELSLAAWAISVVLGFGVALARQSPVWILRRTAATYIWFFRSLPLLVLLIFVYNFPQAFPSTGALLSQPFAAGLIALVLSETAYIAEIHRGALLYQTYEDQIRDVLKGVMTPDGLEIWLSHENAAFSGLSARQAIEQGYGYRVVHRAEWIAAGAR